VTLVDNAVIMPFTLTTTHELGPWVLSTGVACRFCHHQARRLDTPPGQR